MEGDEEIVHAESIPGGRKKRAYIFPVDEANTHENILRMEHYANPRYKHCHLSLWNYEIVTKIMKNVCVYLDNMS